MRRLSFDTIRGRLFVLVLAVGVPLLGVLVWGFAEEVDREHEAARARALRIANAYAATVSDEVRDSRALLERMGARPLIRNPVAGNCDSLFAVIDFFPQYPNLLLYDGADRLVCSAGPQPDDVAASRAAEEAIARLRAEDAGRALPHDPIFVATPQRWLLLTFRPTSEAPRGPGYLALVAYFDIDVSSYPRGTVLTIADETGVVLARSGSDRRWIGTNLRDTEIGRLALGSAEGRGAARGLDGELRQYGFRSIDGTGWKVYVGVPNAIAMASVRSLLTKGLVAGLLVVVVVAVLSMKIASTVEEPLERLAEAVERTRNTGFAHGTPATGPREIAVVADAFNRMVERRALAEAALVDSQREPAALSRRLLEVQEDERRRIAHEIHDQLGQLLTALKMDVGGFLASLAAPSDAQRGMAARITRALDETIESVRRLASELRPAVLDDFGLVAAIQADVRAFEERTGIECEVSTPEESLPIGRDAQTVVYRIVQEALTNVARHSDATRVELRIRLRGDDMLVEVRDDGRGFRAGEQRARQSLGIAFMRERARGIDGELEVEGVAGKGTIVSLRLPLAPRDRETAS